MDARHAHAHHRARPCMIHVHAPRQVLKAIEFAVNNYTNDNNPRKRRAVIT